MSLGLKLNELVCFSLYRASRKMIRMYGPLLEPFGLTYLQFLVLQVLRPKNDMSVKEIGSQLSLDSATLTPLLKKLELRGLAVRSRNPNDERVVNVRLTVEGIDLKKSLQNAPVLLARNCGFSLQDASDLRSAQKILDRILGDDCATIKIDSSADDL